MVALAWFEVHNCQGEPVILSVRKFEQCKNLQLFTMKAGVIWINKRNSGFD